MIWLDDWGYGATLCRKVPAKWKKPRRSSREQNLQQHISPWVARPRACHHGSSWLVPYDSIYDVYLMFILFLEFRSLSGFADFRKSAEGFRIQGILIEADWWGKGSRVFWAEERSRIMLASSRKSIYCTCFSVSHTLLLSLLAEHLAARVAILAAWPQRWWRNQRSRVCHSTFFSASKTGQAFAAIALPSEAVSAQGLKGWLDMSSLSWMMQQLPKFELWIPDNSGIT